MTNSYVAVVSGILSQSTDKLMVEIQAPASTTIKIKKIRVGYGDGTQTVVADGTKSVALITESVAGKNGTSFTPISPDSNAPASQSTVNIGPMFTGTVSTTVDKLSFHSGTDFLWHAADEDDKIVLTPGSIFGIVVNCSG